MDTRMFCFQCEQTAMCKGCTGMAGVCGKKSDTAAAQDRLTGTLVGIGTAAKKNPEKISSELYKLIISGLFTTVTNVNFNNNTIAALNAKIEAEALKAGIQFTAYDMNEVWNAQEDIRSLKSLILFGIRGMAAYAYHASVLGYHDKTVEAFFLQALADIGSNSYGLAELLPAVLEVGEKNLSCMALLDKANTETYGHPVPTEVKLKVEKGPFIIITGHDLYDLRQLLEQTKDKGINIYTHGEMLPAHGYPGRADPYAADPGICARSGQLGREGGPVLHALRRADPGGEHVFHPGRRVYGTPDRRQEG